MKKTNVLMVLAIGVMTIQCGCTANKPQKTGFLTDYSMLKPESDLTYKYMAPGKSLGNYSKFIIEPVSMYFYNKSKIKEKTLIEMSNYMHAAVVKAIEDKYEVVQEPGPGVARVRSAITDLKKSRILMNIWPVSKIVGTGLGGATLEAELIDTGTNEQVAAFVESQLGKRLSLEGLTSWGDAKAVMNRWAARFRKRLDEAHDKR